VDVDSTPELGDICEQPFTAKLLCPSGHANGTGEKSGTLSCESCATVVTQDWGADGQRLFGEVRWGPTATCEANDDSDVDGYGVWLVDECGEKQILIGNVSKKQEAWSPQMLECCHPSWYRLSFVDVALPEAMVGLVIVPFKGLVSLPGTVLPIFPRVGITSKVSSTSGSTATSSSLTFTSSTVTTTPGAATLEGCWSLSVSDAQTFASAPEALDVMRTVLARAAGPEVKPEYVMDMEFLPDGSCDADRRLTQRRLQQALWVDYLIVFPVDLGIEQAVAIAKSSQRALEAVTVEAITSWLQEEVASVPTLEQIDVSVTGKTVYLTLLDVVSDESPMSDLTGLWVALILLAFLPVLIFLLWWRCGMKQQPVPGPPEPATVCLPQVSAEVTREPGMDDLDFCLSRKAHPESEMEVDPVEAEAAQVSPVRSTKKKRLVPKGRARKAAPDALPKRKRLVPRRKAHPNSEGAASSENLDAVVVDVLKDGSFFDEQEASCPPLIWDLDEHTHQDPHETW